MEYLLILASFVSLTIFNSIFGASFIPIKLYLKFNPLVH